MPRLHNFNEVNEALRPYVQLVHSNLGKDTALERIAPLMAAAGNPHEKLKIIHLAGTSGKTSTAYYTAALLRAAGKNVGLTVSPHVDSVAERVQLNGKPLTEAEFCSRLSEFLAIVETLDIKPTYFELLYSFSFWVFAAQQVDYAVVETGMGGLYDPTNIATREDKVCIITDIGFDHMHVLGHTLPEIAAQKAGIIHRHNAVFRYRQADEVNAVIADRAARLDADLHMLAAEALAELYAGGFSEAMADFQRHNWLLAYAAFRYVARALRHGPDRET